MIAQHYRQHHHQEFLRFLKLIDAAVPDGLELHLAFFAAQAFRFGLRRGDGLRVMRWLLDLVGDPGTPRWTKPGRTSSVNRSGPAGRG